MPNQCSDNLPAKEHLVRSYVALHKQGFVPIFVADDFDAVQLAEACVAAGAGVIEITCRRPDVCEDIRRVRRAFPELVILVGSVVDNGIMLDFLRTNKPDFPTVDRLKDIGADGFVSALPLSHETVAKLSQTHLVMPGVGTVTEAVKAIEAGAHFAKFYDLSFSGGPKKAGLLTSAALHGLLPLFVTGGVTLDLIEDYISARVTVLGSGWDVILGDGYKPMQQRPDTKEMAKALGTFLEKLRSSRSSSGFLVDGKDPKEYLRYLSHYHPFSVS